VFLNTSKYFITGSEDTLLLTIALPRSLEKEHVKLNCVSTFLGKDQLEMTNALESFAQGVWTYFADKITPG